MADLLKQLASALQASPLHDGVIYLLTKTGTLREVREFVLERAT